jgi:hypothetical protein
MTKKDGEETRPLSRSEKVKNYLIGIGAASALILGLIAQFKGEPKAEETWEVLRANQNKQAKELNRIRMRLHYFQAYQEAQTALKLQDKLDTLQAQYDKLLASKKVEKVEPAPPAPKPQVNPADCKDGLVRGSDNRCHRVRKPVAKAVKKAVAEADETKRKLAKEMARRLAAERKKRELLKNIKTQMQQRGNDLPALPKKLEDATKK